MAAFFVHSGVFLLAVVCLVVVVGLVNGINRGSVEAKRRGMVDANIFDHPPPPKQ